MPRERRNFRRKSFVRNVQRLFIIATEGIRTEVKYFEEFKSEEYYNNKSVFVEVLKRLSTDSSPENVIKQLSIFKKEYRLREGDELWVVIDRDQRSWKIAQITSVARQCYQKGFGFALSNPCFEAWLLLHRKDYNTYSRRERDELYQNRKTGKRSRLELELLNICGSYNKTNLNVADYLPYVTEAIKRAELLVANDKERWPQSFGSHVYKLVRKLLPVDISDV